MSGIVGFRQSTSIMLSALLVFTTIGPGVGTSMALPGRHNFLASNL